MPSFQPKGARWTSVPEFRRGDWMVRGLLFLAVIQERDPWEEQSKQTCGFNFLRKPCRTECILGPTGTQKTKTGDLSRTFLFLAWAQMVKKLKPGNLGNLKRVFPPRRAYVHIRQANAGSDASSLWRSPGSLDCSSLGLSGCRLFPPTLLPVGILELFAAWYFYPWQVDFSGENESWPLLWSAGFVTEVGWLRLLARWAATREGSFGSPRDGSRLSHYARWRLGARVGGQSWAPSC